MIHKFHMNGVRIVVDVASGAVHAVDGIVFDILDFLDEEGAPTADIHKTLAGKYISQDIDEALSEIKSLKNEGLLFAPDSFAELPPAGLMRKNPVVKALCLHVAHDCNLKCQYCFAEEGEYHGKRQLMSLETGKAALDFLVRSSGARRNLEVDFFGGEPLMNFEVVKGIVEYGRSIEAAAGKNIRFTLTTNGVLLNDQVEDYLNRHMHNVVLSIDGRKAVNDRMRYRAGGQGSYDLILPKFQRLAESRGQANYYVRGTYTRYNMDFANDVLHLAEQGFKQVSVEPVVCSADEPYALRESDVPALCGEYERLAAEMLEREEQGRYFNFFHFMIDLTGGPCVSKRLAGCGAGTEYLAVTPDGKLYPCHQFVGQDGFEMGDVKTGLNSPELYEKFAACNVYAKPECKKCWAKFYCSGGCAANAYHAHGDILKPYSLGCDLQRKRTECAIMMKVAQA